MKQPHILCDENDIGAYVLVVGDPARVDRVGSLMDSYEELAYNREFKTIKGLYKGVEINVTSTGIGGASACIALEELIACGAKNIIRLGSSGAVQEGIGLGDLIIATGAVREDGASKMYVESEYPAVPDIGLTHKLIETAGDLGYIHHYGLVRSHDSFYIDHEMELMEYWSSKNVLGSDMETSILFTLGQLRGIKTASILNNVVLYQGDVKEGVFNYVDESVGEIEGEKREILLALESIYRIENEK